MKIVCSQCNREYNFTVDQIHRFKYSVFPCIECKKLIKIATCPHCGTYYSITFSTSNREQYKLNCMKCKHDFSVSFPVIGDHNLEKTANNEKKNINKNISTIPAETDTHTADKPSYGSFPGSTKDKVKEKTKIASFNFFDIIEILQKALSAKKLITAGLGLVLMSLITMAYDALVAVLTENQIIATLSIVRDFFNLFPVALFFYIYLIIASALSKITYDEHNGISPSNREIVSCITGSLVPLTLGNVLLVLIATSILFLFGNIPVVGPFLFSLMYLPLYLLSVAVVILVITGFWFLPPVTITHGENITVNAKAFWNFLLKNHLKLVFVIPVLTIFSGIVFSAAYFIHFASYSLLAQIGDALLSKNGIKVYSAVPSNLLNIFGLSLFGADTSVFKSLMGNLNFSHFTGGFIIGTLLSLITVFLYSILISIIATVSTHVYMGMEKGLAIEEKKIIQILVILILFLLSLILFKKLIF